MAGEPIRPKREFFYGEGDEDGDFMPEGCEGSEGNDLGDVGDDGRNPHVNMRDHSASVCALWSRAQREQDDLLDAIDGKVRRARRGWTFKGGWREAIRAVET
jgi:hypothetical protein